MESENWWSNYKKWFKRRGLSIRPIPFHNGLLRENKVHIVQGISPRGNEHVVIYKGKKKFYDPNINGGFLKKKPHTYWKISKLPANQEK